MQKFKTIVVTVCLLVLVIYEFRTPVLQWFATYLIVEDPLQKADALFVLSGGGYDRGNEAVKIFNARYVPVIICTGGNPALEFKVFGFDTLESDLTAANLRRQGIPDSLIVEIRKGTSTKEEAAIIQACCEAQGFKKIIILSSKVHTYRVNGVFRKALKEQGIELIVRGAPASNYDEMHWWQSENGLITINNEWIKTFYYWWKY